MAYTKSIPLSTDYIDQSQPQIKSNFESIDNMLNVNHGAFNGADEGKHKWATLVDQVAPPVILATEASIFYGTYNTVKDLYYQIGAGTPKSLSTAGAFSPGVHGYTVLQSGMIMMWGEINLTIPTVPGSGKVYAGGVVTIYPKIAFFPALTINNLFSVQITPTSANTSDPNKSATFIDVGTDGTGKYFRFLYTARTTATFPTSQAFFTFFAIGN